MSVQTPEQTLTRDVLAHLDAQIASARRMLAVVLEQSAAIRQRSTQQIVRLAGQLQAEIHRRETIELERAEILKRGAALLDVPANEIKITMLTELMSPEYAQTARQQSAHLREILGQIEREHSTNQVLMRQELSFLDHLLRLAGTPGTYGNQGLRNRAAKRGSFVRRPVIELEA